MKSLPHTMRGPVDDRHFSWEDSRPRLYESRGEAGLRATHRPSPMSSTRHQRRSRASTNSTSRDDETKSVILPKIATGRSAHSAKKLWKDFETNQIRTVIQKELETPRVPPLYIPKNPKPLYKRPVDELRPFDILHLREFAERGEVDVDDVTDCREFYSQISFLRNAVRNTDGTTSYQNLCRRPRSWSEPSPTDNKPGLIKGNKLHWQSAATSLKHPRMLLPLQPGPSTKWYAWRVHQRSKSERKAPLNPLKDHVPDEGNFVDVFSPRAVPNPTPANASHLARDKTGPGRSEPVRTGPHNLEPARIGSVAPVDSSTVTTQGVDAGDQVQEQQARPDMKAGGLTFITEEGRSERTETVSKSEGKDMESAPSQDIPSKATPINSEGVPTIETESAETKPDENVTKPGDNTPGDGNLNVEEAAINPDNEDSNQTERESGQEAGQTAEQIGESGRIENENDAGEEGGQSSDQAEQKDGGDETIKNNDVTKEQMDSEEEAETEGDHGNDDEIEEGVHDDQEPDETDEQQEASGNAENGTPAADLEDSASRTGSEQQTRADEDNDRDDAVRPDADADAEGVAEVTGDSEALGDIEVSESAEDQAVDNGEEPVELTAAEDDGVKDTSAADEEQEGA